MADLPVYVMDRTFDAPPALVWETWTSKAHLSRWYGPGVETVIHALDVRPGGEWRVEMRSPQWSSHQLATYVEVEEGALLSFDMSMTDADWQLAPNPQMPDWPQVLRHEVRLVADGAGTKMTLTVTPVEASEAEIACFAAAMGGMGQGWGSGMEVLAEILAELQAA